MPVEDIPPTNLDAPSFERDVSAWPQLKISRAIQHIKDLEGRIAVWSSARPLTTEGGITADSLRWQTRIRIYTPPPLLEWSLIAGDCFHVLRGSLDACVWELAHLNGAIPSKPELLQFPILQDGAKWEKARRDRLQSMPDEIADRIKVLQPFNRSPEEMGRDPLVCLNWLDILDKHRSSIGVNIQCDRISPHLKVRWREPNAAERNLPPNMTFYTPELIDGAVVMELVSLDPIAHVEGDCRLRFVFTVDTVNGREELFGLAGKLIQYVQQVHAGLVGGLVKDDAVGQSAVESSADWKQVPMSQDGNVFRTAH